MKKIKIDDITNGQAMSLLFDTSEMHVITGPFTDTVEIYVSKDWWNRKYINDDIEIMKSQSELNF